MDPDSGARSEEERMAALEGEVKGQIERRRAEARRLAIEERKPVREVLEHLDNDYSLLDQYYTERAGCSLVANPYESAEHEIPITKSCSIVIPAYNNSARLENCLRSIEASTFNAKYPGKLEVVVVDDGSPAEDLADKVREMGLDNLTVRVYRQSNGQVSKGRYSGVLNARNDIVIMTDPDVVYTPNTIEEYMKRHEVLDNVVFFGLRQEIDTDDERLTRESVSNGSLTDLSVNIGHDRRVAHDSMLACDWLKRGGHDAVLPVDTRSRWSGWRTASLAWGLSVSAKREELLVTMAGYDSRYVGYGGDDEDMVSRLMCLGNYVIPNTGGLCYHQRHPIQDNEEKHQRNVAALTDNVNSPLKYQDSRNPTPTDAQIRYEAITQRKEAALSLPTKPGTAQSRGAVEYGMGNYGEAIRLLRQAEQENPDDYWTQHDIALTEMGLGGKENYARAVERLRALIPRERSAQVCAALAQAYGLLGHFQECLSYYDQAFALNRSHGDVENLASSPDLNYQRGVELMNRGLLRDALYFINMAIAQAGEDALPWAVFDRGKAFMQLSDPRSALASLIRAREFIGDNTWVDSFLGYAYEQNGRVEEARQSYNQALEKDPSNGEALAGLRRTG